MRNDQERLLREYVRLRVHEAVDFGGGGIPSTSGWMYLGPLTEPLTGLWQPFVDVGKTALAGALDIGNRAIGLFKNVLHAVTKSIVPFGRMRFEEINANTRRRTQAIMQQYADVFKRTDQALQHNDFRAIVFMLNPALYIVGMASPSADAFKNFASSAERAGARASSDALRQAKQLYKLFAVVESASGRLPLITEETRQEVIDNVTDSEMAIDLRHAAMQILSARVSGFVNASKALDGVKTLDELQAKLGQGIEVPKQAEKLGGEELRTAHENIIDTARKELKKAMSLTLKGELAALKQALGGDEEITKLYGSALSSI